MDVVDVEATFALSIGMALGATALEHRFDIGGEINFPGRGRRHFARRKHRVGSGRRRGQDGSERKEAEFDHSHGAHLLVNSNNSFSIPTDRKGQNEVSAVDDPTVYWIN